MPDYYEPETTAGLGLIFRLNALWEKADRKALSGDLDAWELILDRIFSNLLYRNEVEINCDEDGGVCGIKITEKDFQIWKKQKADIREAKAKVFGILRTRQSTKVEYRRAKEQHYFAIMVYDIWIRKLMQELRLYMKESESNPSMALFGRSFGKKGGK